MTQAELAGNMANGPQARPAKGQLIRDFTLTSTRWPANQSLRLSRAFQLAAGIRGRGRLRSRPQDFG